MINTKWRWTVLLGILAALWLTPASAHTDLSSSNPKNGAVLDQAPTKVSLTFTEEVKDPAYVVVNVADSKVPTSKPAIKGRTVSVDLTTADPGDYRVAYRIISVDGHPVSGLIKFKVRAADQPSASTDPTPAPATPAPAQSPAPGDDAHDHDEPNWFQRHPTHIAWGIGLLALAGALIWWSRRRSA